MLYPHFVCLCLRSFLASQNNVGLFCRISFLLVLNLQLIISLILPFVFASVWVDITCFQSYMSIRGCTQTCETGFDLILLLLFYYIFLFFVVLVRESGCN